MKNLYLQIKSDLENCTNKTEALRILSINTSKIFNDYQSVYTNISSNVFNISTCCSQQIFATIEIVFSITEEKEKKSYLFSIYLADFQDNEEDNNSKSLKFHETIKTEDHQKINLLIELIEEFIGKVDKSTIEKYKLVKFEDNELEEKTKKVEDFNKILEEKEIVYKLMPFRVKNVLVIASVYDAFTIESEGNLSQKILGEFLKLNLTSFPKIISVTSYEEAKKELKQKHFDVIIYVVGNNKNIAEKTISKLYTNFSMLPLYLLINNNSDTEEFIKYKINKIVDNIFVWNGDSRIFFTIIKLLEDKQNLESDYNLHKARIILLVEDTPRFYSKYLPELYMIIFEQVRRILSTIIEADDVFSLFYVRTRPKILHVHSYEEAQKIIDKYNDIILSLITDVEFYRNGIKNENAGTDLAKYFKKKFSHLDIPIIIQSRDLRNKEIADQLNCSFIHKESPTLVHDIRHIVKYNMGFGDFIYKTKDGKELGYRAHNFEEFLQYLDLIPDDSLAYHAFRNHFSLWLKARGEFNTSEMLTHLRIEDFKSINKLREFLKTSSKIAFDARYSGNLITYEKNVPIRNSLIYTLYSGALGGKGRGLYFINKLIFKYKLKDVFRDEINFITPLTFIIGTDAYDEFIDSNNLNDFIYNSDYDYKKLKEKFLHSKLNPNLISSINTLLEELDKPLIVRSSGLSEDSMNQSFAGIFETIIIDNKNPDKNERLKELTDAIKLVYASVFSEKSRKFFNSIDYKIEEEKMAVIIQRLVGTDYSGYYYPHISGIAQSYNFYPYSYLKPEDGICRLAFGLGKYVEEGEQAFIFAPGNPLVQNASMSNLLKNSQKFFYALNLNQNQKELKKDKEVISKLNISDALKHGTLKQVASVFDPDNNIINPGIDKPGQIVINFDNILKYKYIPLIETINKSLEYIKKSMASEVEIEFAIDLKKDDNGLASFYLLQIKPHMVKSVQVKFDFDKIEKKEAILYTDKIMGNGIISDVEDIIFINPQKFDKSKTIEMSKELEYLNEKMIRQKKKYVLIVPGRLGTRDRWLGVPVKWRQINNACVIVETNFPDFPVDLSSGSHFFHHVISMQIGYFSVNHEKTSQFINYELLNKQKKEESLNFFEHIKFNKPFIVMMNGRKGQALINTKPLTKE